MKKPNPLTIKTGRQNLGSFRKVLRSEQFMLSVSVAFDEATSKLWQDSVERARVHHMCARVMDELTRPEWNV